MIGNYLSNIEFQENNTVSIRIQRILSPSIPFEFILNLSWVPLKYLSSQAKKNKSYSFLASTDPGLDQKWNKIDDKQLFVQYRIPREL